jgi:hypothetical protein
MVAAVRDEFGVVSCVDALLMAQEGSLMRA